MGQTLLVFALVLGPVAAQLPHWNWRNPLPHGNDLTAVTYGEGRFVAVGAGGAVVTSTDGNSWSQAYSATKGYIADVAHGNGRFVAVGFQVNGTMVSDDGVVWQHVPPAGETQAEWGKVSTVTFAAGKF